MVAANDIIWNKTKAIPHPVEDRFTNRHEHLFLFTRSARYWFELTPAARNTRRRDPPSTPRSAAPKASRRRQPGDVWALATNSLSTIHSAKYTSISRPAGCLPGRVVLDPFSGSGTTAGAALALDRRFIGVDLSATYHDEAIAAIDDDSAAATA